MLALAIVTIITLTTTNLQASIVVDLPLPELVQNADIIAHVKVLTTESIWKNPDNPQRIVTVVTAKILNPLKNTPDNANLTFNTLGGKIGDIIQTVQGEANFKPGDEAVVFLEKTHDALILLGMSTGKYEVLKENNQKIARRASKNIKTVRLKKDPTHDMHIPNRPEDIEKQPGQNPDSIPLQQFLDEISAITLSSQQTLLPPKK